MPSEKQYRHEYKYLISPHEYYILRSRLAPILQQDKNAKSPDGYHIRSLYFDDVYDSSLYEKNAGVQEREKFRIRIYDKSNSVIKLERKGKMGNFINKESAPLSLEEYYAILNGKTSYLAQSRYPVKKLFYARMKTNLLKPSVIVDYERDAFIYPVSQVRVTFDKHLSTVGGSLDVFDETSHIPLPTMYEKSVIMEVKYNEVLPDIVRDRLCVNASMQALSKYVLCRMALENYNLKGC